MSGWSSKTVVHTHQRSSRWLQSLFSCICTVAGRLLKPPLQGNSGVAQSRAEQSREPGDGSSGCVMPLL